MENMENMDIGNIADIADEAEKLLDIEKKIAEYEKLLEQKKLLTEKLKEKEKTVLAQIKEQYGLTKNDIEYAAELKINNDDLDMKGKIIAMIEDCGEKVTDEYKETFRKYAHDIHIAHVFEQIPMTMLKQIISIDAVKQYIMKKEKAKEADEIEKVKRNMRTGRLSDNTKYALKYIADNSPSDKEYMTHMKKVKQLTTADANRIRWYLLHKQYIIRNGGRLVITNIGKARLSDE